MGRNGSRLAILAAALALGGCGGTFTTAYDAIPDPDASADWRVTGVKVRVPDAATTTEANALAPNADIVWHGDLEGERKAQAAAILSAGLKDGARGMVGSQRVGLFVLLDRFHGVTPISMNVAPAAVHDIEYRLWVMDMATGQTLMGPVDFEADLLAYTQTAAEVAAAEGRTEKQRIEHHIERVTRHWLGRSDDDPRGEFVSLGR